MRGEEEEGDVVGFVGDESQWLVWNSEANYTHHGFHVQNHRPPLLLSHHSSLSTAESADDAATVSNPNWLPITNQLAALPPWWTRRRSSGGGAVMEEERVSRPIVLPH